MRRLASDEGGFGLIELVIAMIVMSIGITAIVAGFSSGIVALNSASRASTAGTIADKQMEAYRLLPYTSIGLRLSPALGAAVDSTYTGDPALAGDSQTGTANLTTGAGALFGTTGTEYDYCSVGSPVTCTRIQSPYIGPDKRSYRVDSYVVWYCAVGTLTGGTTATPTCTTLGTSVARPVKRVTIVVRDGTTTSKTYVRQTSTFDQAT